MVKDGDSHTLRIITLRRRVRIQAIAIGALSAIMISATPRVIRGAARSAPLSSRKTFTFWGQSVLKNTFRAFLMSGRGLLAEKAIRVNRRAYYRPGKQPAFAWSQALELLMLAEATKCDRRYAGTLKDFATTLQAYWRVGGGVGGFNVLPGNSGLDRYYDDNEWMTWGFLRAYSATHDTRYLSVARHDFRFVLSGESTALGGGIFWHEQAKTSKNTCSNAPAVIDALQLFRITHRREYLRVARQIYRWTNSRLLDRRDYLYFDHIDLNGKINRTKWTYNAGAMLIANCLFYRVTHRSKYLRRAVRIASSAQSRWIDPANGAIGGPGVFAWVLLDGFLHLYKITGNAKWLHLTRRSLEFLHRHCPTSTGFYGGAWNVKFADTRTVKLINQACVGGSYFLLACNLKSAK
jgi:uncharacterized protein YyaL (SSP411 family)